MRRRILKENKEDSTAEDFLQFLEIIKEKKLFKGVQWGFTDGHASRYLPFEIFKKMVEKQIGDSKKTNSPITNYWVWKIGPFVKGIDSREIDNAIKEGLKGVLELGKANEDIDFGKIGTDFTSKDKKEFAKAMSGGEFGSLDENEGSDDDSLADLGDELAGEIKKILSNKKKELNEIDVASLAETILSSLLASTTLLNIISKWVKKFLEKYNFEKGAKGAEKVYNFTHKLENDFKSPIRRIVGLFTKNEKVKRIVTDSLYSLLIITLGVRAGGDALDSVKLKNAGAGLVSSLKAALKGKDLATLVKGLVTGVV